MGMQLDMRQRHTNMHIDDHARQNAIKNARRIIFEEGTPLSSKHLKGILGKFSGVPTHVSSNTRFVSYPLQSIIVHLECLLNQI